MKTSLGRETESDSGNELFAIKSWKMRPEIRSASTDGKNLEGRERFSASNCCIKRLLLEQTLSSCRVTDEM